jgi:glycosyltransferase involved in cell wall biosynthesis
MRLIFHIPLKIDRNDPSASQIRPQKLMKSFAELGWEMDVVEGRARDRKRQIAGIKRKIRQGVHYDFVYSESSTMPTLLTEPHHLPTYPCLDFGFLAFCKRHSIPVGLFYRDIHWQYTNKGEGFKQWVARFFYRYDLWQYGRLLDVLFLPTLPMLDHVPHRFGCKVVELPSGLDACKGQRDERETCEELGLLYVGGVGGNYNLKPLMQAVGMMQGVMLTFCCRTYDWDAVREDYASCMAPNVSVVHLGGDDLNAAYDKADLFVMPMSTEYVRFAAPYKLFEAIGHGLPIVAAKGTWSGDFVERNRIGCGCLNDADALRTTLQGFIDHRERLKELKRNMPAVAENNTWPSRCRQIASALLRKEV